MREWVYVLQFVKDNITLLVFLLVVLIMGGTWVVIEALRSHGNREEVFRLRMKVSALERERTSVTSPTVTDPVVLSSRWVRTGGAATTTDGGCLLYVDKILPAIRSAGLTVRVDGYAIVQNQNVRVGERLEANGRNGTYILQLYAVEAAQALIAIALRNRHKDVENAGSSSEIV
jgi:hypothetical protein